MDKLEEFKQNMDRRVVAIQKSTKAAVEAGVLGDYKRADRHYAKARKNREEAVQAQKKFREERQREAIEEVRKRKQEEGNLSKTAEVLARSFMADNGDRKE